MSKMNPYQHGEAVMRNQIVQVRKSLSRLVLLLAFVLVVLASSTDVLLAASYSVAASGPCEDKEKASNRFAGDGLILTTHDACDWEYVSPFPEYTFSGKTYAGAYGSDTSLSDRVLEASIFPINLLEILTIRSPCSKVCLH